MRKIRNIFLCTLGSILIIFILEGLYYLRQRDNGFNRKMNLHATELKKSVFLKNGGYYFAGSSGNNIYLANSYNKEELIATNYAISELVFRQMQIEFPADLFLSYSRVQIDSVHLFITEGLHPVVIKEPLFDYTKDRRLQLHSTFNLFIVLSDSCFIIRNLDTILHQNILQKIILRGHQEIKESFVLQKKGDGFFSTDGTLLYDKHAGDICYVYRYRNEMDILDSDLHLIRKAKTIDTTNAPAITIESINSDKEITFSAPPVYINKYAALSDKYLITQSGLRASNENKDVFDHNSVVDLYDLSSLQYLYSFYLPDQHGEKLQDLILCDTAILVLYDHYLCSYRIQ